MTKDKGKRLIILNAATKTFSKKGFYNASISDIAETAEVGKGTIYEYFKSKEELFVEVVKCNFAKCFDLIESEIGIKSDFEGKIDAFVNINSKLIDKNMKIAHIMRLRNEGIYLKSETKERLSSIISQYRKQLISIIIDIFRMGQKEDKVKDIDKEFTADIFVNMIIAYSMRSLAQDDEIKIEKEKKQLIELIKYGISI
ncbi:MAG: TetR/AcrR family transcriptional regulator [Clostridia bacterium]|nr:TetR/AcrR family transcriptional regulator [Clostridia bacterium]